MHISLDSALGRQRRLNSVGESITQIAPDPAAAYSLRSLTGGDPKVVRVRRASDNHEQDFTASDVSSGALQDFVNAQVTAPLDIRALTATGRDGDFLIAKAAYSLRSLGTRQATVTSSGDTDGDTSGKFVCQVRSVTGDVKSFTATEVSDGTLVDFVLGNTKSLLNSRAYFDGSNDEVVLTNEITMSGDFSIQYSFVITESGERILGRTTTYFIAAEGSGEIDKFKAQVGSSNNTMTLTSNLKYGEENTVKFKRVSGKIGIYNESDTLISNEVTVSGDFVVNAFGRARALYAKGVIYNIRIDTNNDGTINHSYNGYGNTLSDWTDLVGSNNASAVNGSPALFTGQDQDGFVKTWYDQSVTTQAGDTATGNHATQGIASKQPTIVSAGTLLNELVFDGSNHFLRTLNDFDAFGANSLGFFMVVNPSSTSGNPRFLNTRAGTPGIELILNVTPRLYYKDSGGNGTNGATQSASLSAGTEVIYTNLVDRDTDQTVDAFKNGSSVTTGSPPDLTGVGSVNAVELTIGANNSGGNLYNGKAKEIIIYASNQEANRTAIEANIGEAYSINLPAGVDPLNDEVDGFVETWYDQSGNGNDAVQATAANQPKIVDSATGALVPGGVLFTGSSEGLQIASASTLGIDGSNNRSIFSVLKTPSGTDGFMIFGGTGGTSAAYRKRSSNTSGLSRIEIQGSGFEGAEISDGNTHLFSSILDGTQLQNVSIFVDGSETSGSGTATLNTADNNFFIGSISSSFAENTGTLAELIVYASSQTANRVALETNINSHYSIF